MYPPKVESYICQHFLKITIIKMNDMTQGNSVSGLQQKVSCLIYNSAPWEIMVLTINNTGLVGYP